MRACFNMIELAAVVCELVGVVTLLSWHHMCFPCRKKEGPNSGKGEGDTRHTPTISLTLE